MPRSPKRILLALPLVAMLIWTKVLAQDNSWNTSDFFPTQPPPTNYPWLSQALPPPNTDPTTDPTYDSSWMVHPAWVELPNQDFDFEMPKSIPTSKLRTIDGAEPDQAKQTFPAFQKDRYTSYRSRESALNYMPGDGDQFGWVDFYSTPYIASKKQSSFTVATGIHWLSGPNTIPLPARLWDLAMGYQNRETLEDLFSYDIAANVGVYSDFRGSSREGVRAMGHAVGITHASDRLDLVAGVDYLNRDDYKILPVFGFSWHDSARPRWRWDVLFPRPRVDYYLSESRRLYMAGLLGGGTWAIELPGYPLDRNDTMTYRDYRLLFGREKLNSGGIIEAFELGWIFNRSVDLRHSGDTSDFRDAFLMRWVTRY